MHQLNNIAAACSLISFVFGIVSFFNPTFAVGSMTFSPLALLFSKFADRFSEVIADREAKNNTQKQEDTSLKENVFKEISKDLIDKFELTGKNYANNFDEVLEYIESIKQGESDNQHWNNVIKNLVEDIGEIP